ncbi:hypothetical protein D3C87_1822350 [compost metagenome]
MAVSTACPCEETTRWTRLETVEVVVAVEPSMPVRLVRARWLWVSRSSISCGRVTSPCAVVVSKVTSLERSAISAGLTVIRPAKPTACEPPL